MSEYVTLEEFVAVDESGAEPLAASSDGGSVIPAAGGLVVVYGNGGAGKTTMLIDGAMHLAAGVPWVGLVHPTKPLTIVQIENEGPRPEFRKKLRKKHDAWEGPSLAGHIHIHEDPWGAFSFVNAAARATLLQRLHDTEAELLIAGPVKEIGMRGAGTDDDITEFLSYVQPIRDMGVTVVLVHHENRAGQISGAWESRPDTLVHVQAQGHGRTRLFWQKCRWSSELHQTATNLLWAPGESYTVEEREEITEATIAADILAAVLELPGGSWSKLRTKVKGNDNDKAAVRDRLLAEIKIVNTATRDGYFNLWASDDPAASRAEPSTGLARLPVDALGPSRARARSIEHEARNGTGEPEHDDDERESRWDAIFAAGEPELAEAEA